MHAAAQPSPADPGVRARRDGALRGAVRGRRVGRGLRRARRRGAARDVGRPCAPGQPRSKRASRPWRRPTATRTLPRIAIGSRRSSGPPPACNASRDCPGARSWSPPGRVRTERWEIVLVRRGRLAGTSVVPVGVDPEAVGAGTGRHRGGRASRPGPLPASSAEETECVLRWLDSADVRLVRVEGDWACPVHGAASVAARYGRVRSGAW